jgi:hypothetical protein
VRPAFLTMKVVGSEASKSTFIALKARLALRNCRSLGLANLSSCPPGDVA